MQPKSLITLAATAALLGVPAPALAGRPAEPGPPAHAGHPADAARPAPGSQGSAVDAQGVDQRGHAKTPSGNGSGDDQYTDPLGRPTPGPAAPAATKAKAYGRYCAKQSRRHVAGQKGTPFSQCVTAMAKLAKGTTKSPVRACKALSRKHVAGTRGTPFSRCVVAAAKLHKSLARR
jgi:hypothetical protein